MTEATQQVSDSWAPVKAYFVVSNIWSVIRDGGHIKYELCWLTSPKDLGRGLSCVRTYAPLRCLRFKKNSRHSAIVWMRLYS